MARVESSGEIPVTGDGNSSSTKLAGNLSGNEAPPLWLQRAGGYRWVAGRRRRNKEGRRWGTRGQGGRAMETTSGLSW